MKKRIYLPLGLLVCSIVAIVIACHVHYGETVMHKIKSASSHYGVLSEAEKRVIIEKGTERPFTGKYDNFFEFGVYACRNCGVPLYVSDDKFNAGCGWPSFDDSIPGAVSQSTDSDGRRTEVTCTNCGAHLGHVFSGEKHTEKNIRHCVNSISMVFEHQDGENIKRAVFAGGCFWGVEELFKKQKGVLAAVSGYTGGKVDNPSYREVCSGKTGHVEAVEILYNPKQTDFETLSKYFLEIHDPTQKNRQGPDIGEQYRSVIFYFNESQKTAAQKLLDILRSKGYEVQTQLLQFTKFWNAEPYHQSYYENNGKEPYCHFYQKRF